MSSGPDDKDTVIFRWFHEYPKIAPAVIALVLYLLAGAAILVVTIRARSWFMLTITVTAVLEFAGYAARVHMLQNPSMGPYVTSKALLIISPVLLSIVNYITVGRILRYVDTSKGWLKPAWVGWIFTASDIFCLLLQGSGGGLSASVDASSRTLGKNLLLVGLAIQMFFFTIFLCITVYIHRCRAYNLMGNEQFRPIFIGLYSTIGLMYVRNVFRFIEFTQGHLGYLATHEAYFYIFDFALIFSCFLLYYFYHMGYYLKRARQLGPRPVGDVGLHQINIPATASYNSDVDKALEGSNVTASTSSSTAELYPRAPVSACAAVKNASWV